MNGVLTVKATDSMSQADLQYQVYKTLEHLPLISGSERNLKPYVIQKHGTNISCNVDEYNRFSNLGNGYDEHDFEVQDEYIIVLNGSLRDRKLEETYREIVKWLMRLAKRIWVSDILISVSGYDKDLHFKNILINPSNNLAYDLYDVPYTKNKKEFTKNNDYWFGNWAGNSSLERWYSYKEDNNHDAV